MFLDKDMHWMRNMRQKRCTFCLLDLILIQKHPRGRKHHSLLQQRRAEPSPKCCFTLRARGKLKMFSLKHLHCQHWKMLGVSKSCCWGWFGQSWHLKDKSQTLSWTSRLAYPRGLTDKLNIRTKLIKERWTGVFNSLKTGIRPGLRNPWTWCCVSAWL